jgi:hypothetical protein
MCALPLHAILCATVVTSSITITLSEPGKEWRGSSSSFTSNKMAKGSGFNAVEETKTASFSSVTLRGPIDPRVGNRTKSRVVISGHGNLLEYVETRVSRGELMNRLEPGSYNFPEPSVVNLQTPI